MAQRDPYMRDRNISSAAGLQVVAGTGLGAGLGWAIAGWFNFGIDPPSPSAPCSGS